MDIIIGKSVEMPEKSLSELERCERGEKFSVTPAAKSGCSSVACVRVGVLRFALDLDSFLSNIREREVLEVLRRVLAPVSILSNLMASACAPDFSGKNMAHVFLKPLVQRVEKRIFELETARKAL